MKGEGGYGKVFRCNFRKMDAAVKVKYAINPPARMKNTYQLYFSLLDEAVVHMEVLVSVN